MNTTLKTLFTLALTLTSLLILSGCKKRPRVPTVTTGSSETKKTDKKRIAIITCNGGGGHMAATKALTEYLAADYELVPINMLTDIWASHDLIRSCTFGRCTGEDFYNLLINKKWFWCMNNIAKLGKIDINLRSGAIQKSISTYMKKVRPDLIISVMPLFNGFLQKTAHALRIPLVIIPTDIDLGAFVHKMQPHDTQLVFGIPFYDAHQQRQLKKAGISKSMQRELGFPLREAFFQEKDRTALAQEFGVKPGQKIITVLMGAAGSSATVRYVKELLKLQDNLCIIACIGRNTKAAEQLRSLKVGKGKKLIVVGFTDRIADYMAAADLLITKSGTVSVCEAIKIKVPILLDQTSGGALAWEAYNAQLIANKGFGEVITSFTELPNLVHELLQEEEQTQIRSRLRAFDTNSFNVKIQELVRELLPEKEA
jgi:UDP-N-acetylglucosamine:LPS N-acetylglucosamine transferase